MSLPVNRDHKHLPAGVPDTLPRLTLSGDTDSCVIFDEDTATPSDPTQDSQAKIYLKSNAIVFQFNDGGTVRYKSLTLTGTGVTWVHSTTPP
jgi:hypothetical protein